MLDITLLGTSALMPLPERALTAATLACCGRKVLFDCGEGTQTAARRAHVSLMDVDLIALTHYHGDHIFGLPGLLQTMGCLGRTDPLAITGPKGLGEAMGPVMQLAGRQPFDVRLLEMPEGGLCLRDLNRKWPMEARLCAFSTEHRVPSQGYVFELGRAGRFDSERAKALDVPVGQWKRLQAGQPVWVGERTVEPDEVLGPPRRGLKFVFSGDTTACPALESAAREADLLICEATYAEEDQAAMAAEHGHMTFSQAGALAARAGARWLWLCHFSQMIDDPAACIDIARARHPGAVCGADGMSLRLGFGD